jgi:hypothetical protein
VNDPRLPVLEIPAAPAGWSAVTSPLDLPWEMVPSLAPLRTQLDEPARQETSVRVCDDGTALWVRFDCTDDRIVATRHRRNAAIYREEVVEVFLAPGTAAPASYLELEVSPAGVLFDARVRNPDERRETLEVDTDWDCPGVRWAVRRDDAGERWTAVFELPWSGLAGGAPARAWRGNFYRIDRAVDPADDEYSCWSPTLTDPADFHRPSRFGWLHRTVPHRPAPV